MHRLFFQERISGKLIITMTISNKLLLYWKHVLIIDWGGISQLVKYENLSLDHTVKNNTAQFKKKKKSRFSQRMTSKLALCPHTNKHSYRNVATHTQDTPTLPFLISFSIFFLFSLFLSSYIIHIIYFSFLLS